MPNQTDAQAAGAIRAHHRELHDGLRSRVLVVEDTVRDARPHGEAQDSVLAYLDGELLPHAAAEEVALYPAGDVGAGELLVRAMRDEHRNLIAHVERLRTASDGITAVAMSSAILALFESHLSKENDLLIPALLSNPDISLVTLLGGMHELVG